MRLLLAYLALGSGPTSRSRLCDLLWDVPDDPRGELRWCLSKLRGVLDDEERRRVLASPPAAISLDLADCFVDAIVVEELAKEDFANATTEELEGAAALFRGDFADGLQADGADLGAWLVGQRLRLRSLHTEILRELARRPEQNAADAFRSLDTWLQVAPFDLRAHETKIDSLVKRGRVRDAECHVGASIHAFEQEGLDWQPLRLALQRARLGTMHGGGIESAPSAPGPTDEHPHEEGRAPRPGSVVVMPFVEEPVGSSRLSQGLTDDIITRLAQQRVLFVIARGTSYALGARQLDARDAGRLLNVHYVVSGTVRHEGGRTAVLVELAETRDAGIVWADETECGAGETLSHLHAVVDRIVAALSEQIERAESKRALTKPPSSLDAWEAYHRGLWHMYRFTAPDNEAAGEWFRASLKLDPTFARAHAGLSFTHFQNVFLSLKPEPEHESKLAIEAAERSIDADDRDPAAHWAMGRALWLSGDARESIAELERSVALSPSFALGHYTLGFVNAQSGDPTAAIASTDYSRQLSPFDPLQFAMLASRAIAHLRLGQREQAAEWAIRATHRPNAHEHVLAIAATSLALVDRLDSSRDLVARIRRRRPGYTVEDCLHAFRFTRDAEELIRHAAREIGFD